MKIVSRLVFSSVVLFSVVGYDVIVRLCRVGSSSRKVRLKCSIRNWSMGICLVVILVVL